MDEQGLRRTALHEARDHIQTALDFIGNAIAARNHARCYDELVRARDALKNAAVFLDFERGRMVRAKLDAQIAGARARMGI